jgi:predicted transcriptional regulator
MPKSFRTHSSISLREEKSLRHPEVGGACVMCDRAFYPERAVATVAGQVTAVPL